jgi:hypothetical protein
MMVAGCYVEYKTGWDQWIQAGKRMPPPVMAHEKNHSNDSLRMIPTE